MKLIGLGTVALHSIPSMAFNTQDSKNLELIGKGNPAVFGKGFSLRKEAYDAFVKMREAAAKDGFSIHVVSSYRNYAHQNRIWERKYKRYINSGLTPQESIHKIIEYSTIPGTSRHHWATDIDIIDANVSQPSSVLQPKHFETKGCFRKLKLWMDQNASTFGFHLVYTDLPDRKGFKYEPWHYSYSPLSSHYLSQYRALKIKDIIANENLLGNNYFSEAFISNYLNHNILDINPELL